MSTLFERMSAIARQGQGPDSMYGKRSKIVPPEKPVGPPYRGWVIWYDAGDFEHGISYRETKWRAQSPAGELIEPPSGEVGSLEWIKSEIDRREKQV